MAKGEIGNVHLDKKFAFLRGEDGIEYFFHKTSFQPAGDGVGFEDLRRGMPVEFDGTSSSKGPRASAVRVAHADAAGA